MLQRINLKNVGPLSDFSFDFGNRLTVMTGDNGVGKTFLLDIIWYVLTRQWPMDVNPAMLSGQMAMPQKAKGESFFKGYLKNSYGTPFVHFNYDGLRQNWNIGGDKREFYGDSSLVVYAFADGSIAVWDSLKNFNDDNFLSVKPSAFVFTSKNVWDGLKNEENSKGSNLYLCNGLIRDLVTWELQKSWEFDSVNNILKLCSPSNFKFKLGDPRRVSINDARDIPTIKMPYGEIPVTMASAGVRRILSLAYSLTWAVSENRKMSRVTGSAFTKNVTFLIDEVESHLHPKWQRQIMSGLLQVFSPLYDAKTLKGTKKDFLPNVQILAATHSPLVMASLEDIFDPNKDKWIDFDSDTKGRILVEERPFEKMGTSDQWLKSEAFDMKSTRSKIVADLMDKVNALYQQRLDKSLSAKEIVTVNAKIKIITEKLLSKLSPSDAYCLRLMALCEQIGVDIK